MLFGEIRLVATFDRDRKSWNTSKAAATAARATVIPTIFRPVRGAIDLLSSTSDSRLIPSGVISNAQDKTSAAGNPRIRTTTNTFIVHAGASKVGKRIDAAWISSQAITA